MSLGDDLQRRWYAPSASPAWWMLPLATLYGWVTGMRRRMYRRGWLRSVRLPVPVIVVGNIVAGGAGKTPLVIALVEGLREHGFNPGAVSRGYGGKVDEPQLLEARPDPAWVGDEPALIHNRTGVPVAVGADRVAASRLLIDAGVDVIVADDGLQHYALGRDVEICVVDGERRFGNGILLPAGPLREPVSRLHDVDLVVCNGGAPGTDEVPMRLLLADAVGVADQSVRKPLDAFSGQRVHAVAGIGNPRRFFDSLRAYGIEVTEHLFPDHRRFAARDLEFCDEAPVLMTEKDAIKCRGFAKPSWWAVPVSADLPDGFVDDLVACLHPSASTHGGS
ncbi:MAG: tetraacyldisaccharide 4'-kinase [Rhodanobacteraceae bacterium]